MQPARLRLGQLLVDAHIVSAEQLEQVLALQKTDGRRLGTLLVESGLVTETQLTQILSQQLSVPWVSLYHIDFSRELLSRVPREVAEKYCLVPIYVRPVRGQGDTLYVAMEDPMNEEALRECSGCAGLPARPMIAAPSAILKAIRLYYGGAISSVPAAGAPSTIPSAAPAVTPLAGSPRAEASQPAPAVATAPAGSPVAAAAPEASVASATATSTLVSRASGASIAENGAAMSVASAAGQSHAHGDDDAPSLEVREIELPRNPRRRGGLNLTLLDGTTIKLPSAGARKRQSDPPPSEATGEVELTAKDMLAALRAAAHGVDPTDVLGANVRWEKMMAALLTLLLRKHLILERELIEELRKI